MLNSLTDVAIAAFFVFITSKAMAQRISSEQEEKTGHAQALVRCYGDSVEANRKLLEQAASSMEESDMAAFVQVGPPVSSFITVLTFELFVLMLTLFLRISTFA